MCSEESFRAVLVIEPYFMEGIMISGGSIHTSALYVTHQAVTPLAPGM